MRPYLNKDRAEKPRPGTICAAVMVPEEAERWAALQPADESKHHRHYPAAYEVCPACHEGPGADLMPALLLLRGKPSSKPEDRSVSP